MIFPKVLPFAKFWSKKSEPLRVYSALQGFAYLEMWNLGASCLVLSLQLWHRWVWTDQHEGPTNRLSQSSCTSESTKVEERDRSGGGNPSLIVERFRLFEKKEDISVETNSESELAFAY